MLYAKFNICDNRDSQSQAMMDRQNKILNNKQLGQFREDLKVYWRIHGESDIVHRLHHLHHLLGRSKKKNNTINGETSTLNKEDPHQNW
jgi:hypothetical protein